MIVLIGFMGAGKTTVGNLLASSLGLPFIDTDDQIERARGSSVAEIFETEGEAAFRALERHAVERALAGPDAVVAVGGGAIKDPSTRAELEWHTVVLLAVAYPEAMRRLGHDPGRPLLHLRDPRALFDERTPLYEALADHVIDATAASPKEVAAQIVELAGASPATGPAPVVVDLGPRSYNVFVGGDLAADLGALIDSSGCERAIVITHPHLAAAAKPMIDSLAAEGLDVTQTTVGEGEASKTLAVAGRLLDDLSEARVHRGDVVVSFGGGVICDLAGFVASIYHRGMNLVHVPTTLLAQVDAAIGGKTAVNLPAGKNLAGTIYQPRTVVCDTGLLRSLPPEEIRSGLAEVIKYGFISDPSLLDLVTTNIDGLLARDEDLLATVVRRSVAIKARVVAGDENESGGREVLNYGHTFGHAIEHVTGSRHGDAIGVGMMAAAHLAHALGMLSPEDVDRHGECIRAAGLPTATPFDVGAVLGALGRDKKHRGTTRFVLLDAIGSPRTGVSATDEQIEAAVRSVNG